MAESSEHEKNEPGSSPTPDTPTPDTPKSTTADPDTSDRSTSNMTQPLETPTSPPDPVPTATGTAPPTRAGPETSASTTRGRRTPDVLTLVVGLVSLAAAAMVLAGWIPQLRLFDLRWVLSGGAVVLGVLLLATSARSPRKP